MATDPKRNTKHTVKIHRWIDGVLNVERHVFETSSKAYAFACTKYAATGWLIKIYNEFEELIDELAEFIDGNTYA